MASSLLSIQQPCQKPPHPFALFALGFRPFFLLAGVLSFVSMLVWGGMVLYGWPGPRMAIAPMQWHAHEMVFGYAMAVVAGFLLTAVGNWTNIPTLSGVSLAGLVSLWLAARALRLIAPAQLAPLLMLDLAFDLALVVAITIPLLKAKQMEQLGVASKVLLLGLANMLFYLGALGVLEQGVRLFDWHTPGVWQKPLLWILFPGYGGALFGFALKALTPLFGLSPYLALHAYTVGGIGLMTVGMMAHVALGHTGRSIQEPPRALRGIFALLGLALIARVVLPLFDAGHYALWVGVSQAAWLGAFAWFVWVYAPILVRPRVDGAPG